MTFSLSGTIITQSGTDANLNGLTGIAGVTVTNFNNHSIFNMGGTSLTVSGVLTVDCELEEMLFDTAGRNNGRITVGNGGVLNIGREINVGADNNRFSSGTWVRFTQNNSGSSQETESDLKVLSGGTVNYYGGTLYSRRIIAIMEGSFFNTFSKNAAIIGQHTNAFQIRQRSANTNINGLVTKGYFFTLINNATRIAGWSPFDTPEQAVSFSSTTPSNVFLELEDLDIAGVAGQQVAFWAFKWGRLINCGIGTDVTVAGNSPNSAQNRGLIEVRQSLTINSVDINSLAIDVKVYMSDSDNGSRLAASQINNNPSYIEDRVYSGTSVGGSIAFDTDGGILTGVWWRILGGLRDVDNTLDLRNPANNTDDVFTFKFINYLMQVSTTNVKLKGIGGTSIEQVMLPDSLITESKSLVDAYTSIDTARQFYDKAKSYLFDNFAGETSAIVARSGIEIDAGTYNVNIDATAVSVFAFDGTTITINASTFTGDMITTGVITLLNGALFNGTRTDVNGTVSPQALLTVLINQTGCDVVILQSGTNTVLASVDAQAGNSFSYAYNGAATVDIGVIKQGFTVNYTYNYALSGSNATLPITLLADRAYQ